MEDEEPSAEFIVLVAMLVTETVCPVSVLVVELASMELLEVIVEVEEALVLGFG